MDIDTRCPNCGILDNKVKIDLDLADFDATQVFHELMHCECGCDYIQDVDAWITLDISCGKQTIIKDNKREIVYVDRYTGDLFHEIDNPFLRTY